MSAAPPGEAKVTKAASLANDLVQRFEDQIQSGALPPGTRFPTEKTITEDFGVSRTVVREAFARLAARGLLVSRRGSGAFVAPFAQYRPLQIAADELEDPAEVLRLIELRRAIDGEMAALAAKRRTDVDLDQLRAAVARIEGSDALDATVNADIAFHVALARATDNDYFVRVTLFLAVRLEPARHLYFSAEAPGAQRDEARALGMDHARLVGHVAESDHVAARARAHEHVDRCARRYRACLGLR